MAGHRDPKVRNYHSTISSAAVAALLALAGCATAPPATVCFSPGGHCADQVIHEIGTAKKSIYVRAYSFTHPGIAQALADAEHRGVDVEVILDKSNLSGRYSEAGLIAHAGVKTYIDSRHPIAHDKVVVIDQLEVVTGSFNFTRQADEKNAENLLVIRSASLAAQYNGDWQAHKAHSTQFIESDTGD